MKKEIVFCLIVFLAWPQISLSDAPLVPTRQLIINEVMAGSEVNPEKDHWFELFNPTDEEILLFGWQVRGVTEGGQWIDLVAEDYRAIQPHDFFLISHYTNSRSSALAVRPQVNKTSIQFPPGPLQIELRDPTGRISDLVSLERAADESDFRSYERSTPIGDGLSPENWVRSQNSVNLKEGLVLTFATPFSFNSDVIEVAPPLEPEPPPPSILINEVLPNPKKRETEQEFIELLNVGTAPVDLRGWELDDENSEDDQSYFFIDEARDYLLDPGEFLALYNAETLISLSNLGDGVQLFDTDGNLADDYFYAPALEGRSWGRQPENSENWIPFNHPTPGAINIEVNHPPAPAIHLQQDSRYMTVNVTGEQSYDPDGDGLTFLWEYEPGVTDTRKNPLDYTYIMSGFKTIRLTVTDEFGLFAGAQIDFEAKPVPGSSRPSWREYPLLELISEIMASPQGVDEEGEWVELFNSTDEIVDLSGWFLDDAEGASAPFRIPDQIFLDPGEYRAFEGLDLSFRNSDDEVRLLDPNREPKQVVTFREAIEQWSYAKNAQGLFEWTPLLTPGALNAFPLPPPSYAPGSVVFEAVLPNPGEKDEGKELIRLRNTTGAPIDLKDWKIRDAGGEETRLSPFSIGANQLYTLTQDIFQLTLNNEEEALVLFDPAGNEIDKIGWKEAGSGQWMIATTFLQDGLELFVSRVIDGDTFIADYEGASLVVRLIGVDTPETVHPFKAVQFFGSEASDYLRGRLEGRSVRLTFEPNKLDKYGRLLAYVYLDDSLINAELIEKGYGYAYTRFPFQLRDSFVNLETQAKAAGVGLWQNLKVRKIIEQQQEQTVEEEPGVIPDFPLVIPDLDRESDLDSRLRGNDMEGSEDDKMDAQDDNKEDQDDNKEPQDKNGGTQDDNSETPNDNKTHDCDYSFLKIDSILPNPQKGEAVEFIRLINTGPEAACLAGWALDDVIDKGSKPYFISGGGIAPGGARTFWVSETRVRLNNKDDCVSLLNPAGDLADQICYGKAHKNEVFTHAGGNWVQKQPGATARSAKKTVARMTFAAVQPGVRVAMIGPGVQNPSFQSAFPSSPALSVRQPVPLTRELQISFFVLMILSGIALLARPRV